MAGTTRCPHCSIRFKITKAQLEANNGMVRCGHCLQAFDTRLHFAPEEIDPQLVLPILDETDTPEAPLNMKPPIEVTPDAEHTLDLESTSSEELEDHIPEIEETNFLVKPTSWIWTYAAFLLTIFLIAQAIFFFRVELAARFPVAKSTLVGVCLILKCSIPLPRDVNFMSIESSELKDDPANKNLVILNALLRNRANYAQAFPTLELTLNDIQDMAIARRTFKPVDYLPTMQNIEAGFPANTEIGITLHLDPTDLKAIGYRLVLFYSSN